MPEPAGPPAIDPSRDLDSRAEIHDLVVDFYREVVLDDLLAPIFGEVAEVDWTHHIPRLVDYWCRILRREGGPAGSVTAVHRHLHALEPIRVEHCDRWYALWAAAVDARWAGPSAQRAKEHAAVLMAGMAKHVFGVEWPASGFGDVAAQTAVRPPGVLRDELVDREPLDRVGHSLGQPQVQLADRVGVGEHRRGERAVLEHDLGRATPSPDRR